MEKCPRAEILELNLDKSATYFSTECHNSVIYDILTCILTISHQENKMGIPLCSTQNGSEMLVESPALQYSSFSIIIECGNKIRNKNLTDENAALNKRFILSFQLKLLGVVSFLLRFQHRLKS